MNNNYINNTKMIIIYNLIKNKIKKLNNKKTLKVKTIHQNNNLFNKN